MPNRNAPFIHTITIGTMAGGVGPFVTVATKAGRYVPISKFPFLHPIWVHVVGYVNIPTTILSTGNAALVGVQTFTVGYQNAHRIKVSTLPGSIFVVVGVVTCLTRGGAAYTRAYVVPNPPAL